MSESIIQRAFAAGELAPVLHARADAAKFTQGLKACRNFLVRREGGVSNRAGFRFVNPCKTPDAGTRLMRYVGSVAGESVLIEMGEGYFRFYQEGAIIETAPDTPLEVATPYTLDTLPDWNQSGNVITLTHPAHAPMELIFIDELTWILQPVDTSPPLAAPVNVVGTAGAAGTRTYSYIVTGAAVDSYEETDGSVPGIVLLTAEPTPDVPITLTWDALVGAAEYYVYSDPYENGVFGFIGVAASNSFSDPGLVPDFGLGPPVGNVLFDSSGNYPSCSAQYQQRRWFANTYLEPDAFWGSRTGFRSNYGTSSPLQDDDAVTFRLAGNNHHPIRSMCAIKAGLVMMTDGGEWTVTGGGGPKTPITPSSVDATQETYVGIRRAVRPAIVGNAILYCQARGSIVRELHFEQEVEGLGGRDLTVFATHLFARRSLMALDYQQVPHSIIWCVRSDGWLLGLTYVPDQDVWGWHRHDTGAGGRFEDVCVIPELFEDVVYVIVSRIIGGETVRYIERLERRELLDGFLHATAFFVDSGLSYSGVPANVFSGLEHLEGELVAIVADGVVIADGTDTAYRVTGGTITIPNDAENVHIGLPIGAEIETLDLDVQGTDLRDSKKRVPAVTLLAEQSARTFWAGPHAGALEQYALQAWEGTAFTHTGPLEINLTSEFNHGRVLVRQTDPLPLTIIGIIPNTEVGG